MVRDKVLIAEIQLILTLTLIYSSYNLGSTTKLSVLTQWRGMEFSFRTRRFQKVCVWFAIFVRVLKWTSFRVKFRIRVINNTNNLIQCRSRHFYRIYIRNDIDCCWKWHRSTVYEISVSERWATIKNMYCTSVFGRKNGLIRLIVPKTGTVCNYILIQCEFQFPGFFVSL